MISSSRQRIRTRPRRLPHFRQVQIYAFLCGLPGLLASFVLLLAGDFSPKVWFTILFLAGGGWLVLSLSLFTRIIRPLQTASNMLTALREGDYSMQAGRPHPDDPLGQVLLEINKLREVLQSHRLSALAALGLLHKLVDELDVAVFTFDPENRLRLINPAGARLVGLTAQEALGRTSGELGLETCLLGSRESCLMDAPSLGGKGRWAIRRATFREEGKPHSLLLLTDVSRQLREEERQAWKRLIRVLGHEMNNSLAPIKSLSGSLRRLVGQPQPASDWREDLNEGLQTIQERAESLSRFLQEYARLAKLPPPRKAQVSLHAIVTRVAGLTGGVVLEPCPGPEPRLQIDAAQIEQLLINLVKNAQEAVAQTGGSVRLRCLREPGWAVVVVEDEGPGLANPENLFVPFFSTKPGGSGIGLTLSRQIAEAHDGSLELRNRDDVAHGAQAILRLPV